MVRLNPALKRLLNKGAVEIACVSVATALGQIAMLVGIVIIGRVYGVVEVGRASLLLALGGVAAGLYDFGTSAAWVRDSAAGKLAKSKLADLLGRRVLYAFLLFSFLSAAAYYALGGEYYFLFGAVSFALIVSQTVLVGLRADSRNFTLALVVVLEKLVFLLCFVGLSRIADFGGAPSIVWAQTLAALLTFFLVSVVLGYGGRPRLNFGSPAEIWLTNQYFGYSSVAITAQRLDVPLLTAASGDFAAGQYGAVNRWTQPMGLLTQTFSLVVAPYVARSNSITGGLKAVGLAKTLPLLAVAVCAIVYLIADDVVIFIMGDDFEGAISILRVLAISTALGSLNQPISALLQAVGYEKPVSFVVVAGVLVSLLLTVPLALALAGLGAAVALLVGQLLMNAGLVGILFVRYLERRGRAK